MFLQQPTLESQKANSPQHPWTLVHGFYATMGGIAFEIPEIHDETEKFLPSHVKETWFLTLDGIRPLSKQDDQFLDISEEEITSKSKASGFSKTLVCIQASWFIAQCITRRMYQFLPKLRFTIQEEAILTFPCSCTTGPHQSAGAQHIWSCNLCAADILSLVEETF